MNPTLRVLLFANSAILLCTPPAAGQFTWSDNLDGYAPGTICAQSACWNSPPNNGGWDAWDGIASVAGVIYDIVGRSAPSSVGISNNIDCIQPFATNFPATYPTSGQWTLRAWQALPSTTFVPGSGDQYFIVNNQYQHFGPNTWAIQLRCDPSTARIFDDFRSGPGVPLVLDAWKEIRCEIDLNNDTLQCFYDNQLISSGTYRTSPSHPLAIANLDLYAPPGTSYSFYDDISLTSAVSNNPVPVLTSINPSSVLAGSTAFAMTLAGSGFINGQSQVLWNGSASGITINSISAGQINVTVAASLVSAGGAASVTVFNPPPIGGLSAGIGFMINNPAPALSSINPASVTAGSGVITLTATGAGFIPGSVVRWNGGGLATTYLSPTQIQASLPAANLATAGSASITVYNPPPAGGTSPAIAFTVNNPAPVLTSITPASVTAGGTAFLLSVMGQGFVPSSVVRGGGSALVTTYQSTTQLQASVPASMIATAGSLSITVFNPAPGGGTSSSSSLAVNNPTLIVSATSPSTVPAGSPSFTMIIDGTGFAAGHVARLENVSLATTIVSVNRIHAVVPAASVAAAAPHAVTVYSAAGNTSAAPATLTVRPVVANSHEIFSVDNAGNPANADGSAPSVSRDGRFVAFQSAATNLVAGDTNGRIDIFVRDRLRLITTRVSVSAAGVQGDGDSIRPSLSATGRYVLFTSNATNLTPPAVTSGNQVFRVDRDSDNDGVFDEPGSIPIEIVSLSLVSINPITASNAPAESFSQGLSQDLSVDGKKAVFQSRATDLVATPLNGSDMHIFVRDWTGATPVTVLASATSNTTVPPNIPANASSFEPAMAGGGVYVAFQTDATNLFGADTNNATDVVRKALANIWSVVLVSRATGTGGAQGNGPSRKAAISATGQWIAFESDATNLGPSGAAGFTDVFRRDFGSSTTMQVSLTAAGVPGLGHSQAPAISPTGCIAFRSWAGDLFSAPSGGWAHVFAWDIPNFPVGSPPHVPLSMYSYPYGPMGNGNSGLGGIAVSAGFVVVSYATYASNVVMDPTQVSYPTGTVALVVGTITPFAGITSPPPAPDDHPVSFSVNGPVDPHGEGLAGPRGGGLNGPFGTRLPVVPKAIGILIPPPYPPGDVRDYYVSPTPSEAELFQSEPENPGTAPAGTDNQILVAGQIGLAAGLPAATAPPYRDNINGMSFGEDWFGVTSVSPAPPTLATPWGSRTGLFVEPVVTADSGTSFRFGVDPWAIGLPPTAVFAESLGGDAGAGLGPWFSVGNAGGDVFGTPVLTIPFPAPGINLLVHDNLLLALSAAALPTHLFEDDLDALECVGSNDWGGVVREPGSLHARVLPLEPTHGLTGDLAPPGVANHLVGPAPVFFTVDRNSTGAADSAVRSQYRLGHAAADVFMAWMGTNLLLIDEQEAGLNRGLMFFSVPQDDMDALLLWVDPADRTRLTDLATQIVNSAPTYANAGLATQFRTGPGFTTSLLRQAATGTPLTMKLGFSVTTDSVGLQGTAVDFEAGLDPSGTMQHSGDIFYTEFGPGTANTAPAALLGTNWLWYEEVAIGLDPGAWVLGASTDLALLPDELNALDSLCSETSCPGVILTYGLGGTGTGGYVPALSASGWASPASPIAFTLTQGLGGSLVYAAVSAAIPPSTVQPVMILQPGVVPWFDYVGLAGATIVQLPSLTAGGAGAGSLVIPARFDPATPPGTQLALQVFVVDPAGPIPGGLTPSNGLFLMVL